MRQALLVFGEDDHDRSAIKVLIEGLRPDLKDRVQVEKRRAPMTLVKNLDEAKRKKRSDKLVTLMRAESRKAALFACVFHEDADAVEPAHIALGVLVEQTYARLSCSVVPAVAAWEIEAWWFLFPSAVAAVKRTWKAPDQYAGRNVGLLRNPKEKLSAAVRPARLSARANFRGYLPEDSEAVAINVVQMGLLDSPAGSSSSFDDFKHRVRQL